jgi:3',5'-cyclic AMP phosphodiesterase CpdA
MRIIHFSDTHEAGRPESLRAFFDKRLAGFLNCALSRGRLHKSELLARAIPKMLEAAPDLIVCTGDLTTSGQPGEFKRALAALAPLIDSGVPMLYLPGNHDAYVPDRACRLALEDAFILLNGGRFRLESLPAFFELGGCEIIAIDCARPTLPMLSCGFMSSETSDFVLERAAKSNAKLKIIAGHFPLLERHPLRRFRHKLYGHAAVAKLLKTGALDLSLCGHVHRPYALLDARGGGEVCAGSLTRFGVFSQLDADPSSGSVVQKSVSIA